MSPTLPSPMSCPSYSCCARRMVRRALKPSLRAASCCSVEVVKGGAGLRRRCLRLIAGTRHTPAPPGGAAGRRPDGALDLARLGLVGEAELLDLLAAILQQLQRKGLRAVRPLTLDGPVLLRQERADLLLALADHAQRRALHAPRRQPAAHLLPHQRREI